MGSGLATQEEAQTDSAGGLEYNQLSQFENACGICLQLRGAYAPGSRRWQVEFSRDSHDGGVSRRRGGQTVDLLVAALSLASKCVGEVCVPVASVLPQLQMEDRDVEGVVYATPQIGFDLLKDGVKTGRCYMSFETKHPPQRVAISETWCAFSQ
eukprot:Skav228353  [mRNA]  locus=scaffold5397:57258:61619:- [translate_table: standard]